MVDRLLRVSLGLTDMSMLGVVSVLACHGFANAGCSPAFYPGGKPPLCAIGMSQPGDMLALMLASPLFAAAFLHGLFVVFSPASRDFRAVASRCVQWWVLGLVAGAMALLIGYRLGAGLG